MGILLAQCFITQETQKLNGWSGDSPQTAVLFPVAYDAQRPAEAIACADRQVYPLVIGQVSGDEVVIADGIGDIPGAYLHRRIDDGRVPAVMFADAGRHIP